MRYLAHALLALALIIVPIAFPIAQATAGEHPFAHQEVEADAERYETYLKTNWKLADRKPAELRQDGERSARARSARRLAQLRGRRRRRRHRMPTPGSGSRARCSPSRPTPRKAASATTFPSTPRAPPTSPMSARRITALKARALAVLGDALQRRSYWRPAIDALKTSLALADNAQVREAYEKLRAEHGFRMIDYKTEVGGGHAAPLPAVLGDPRARPGRFRQVRLRRRQGPARRRRRRPAALHRGPDARPALRGADPRRPAVRRRRGPAEDRRRSPSTCPTASRSCASRARTTCCRAAASRASRSSPSTRTKVEVEVYRIGDRNLAGALESGDFERQLSGYEIETIKIAHRRAASTQARWTCRQKLNEEVTTALPVTDAVGDAEARRLRR